MTLTQIGWIGIGLELILFLIWLFFTLFPGSGADPAGKGMAAGFTVALGIYILIGVLLMLCRVKFCTILAILMAALPLLYMLIGTTRHFLSRF